MVGYSYLELFGLLHILIYAVIIAYGLIKFSGMFIRAWNKHFIKKYGFGVLTYIRDEYIKKINLYFNYYNLRFEYSDSLSIYVVKVHLNGDSYGLDAYDDGEAILYYPIYGKPDESFYRYKQTSLKQLYKK